MRSRHHVVEIDPPSETIDGSATSRVPNGDDLASLVPDEDPADVDAPLLVIDDTRTPEPVLREAMGSPSAAPRRTTSAVPRSQPMTSRPPTLPWGFGTDGWPRHNSRLVRLFACDPETLLAGVAGRSWGPLSLRDEARPADGERWPMVIAGELQMPYPSRPLQVELRAQPFHGCYSRVDVVLCSHHRWPRRYFDVASRCVTQMHRLERLPTGS